MEIQLGNNKNRHTSNVDNYIGVDLFSDSKILHDDEVTNTIDEYEQYLKEKDASTKYRVSFTISPYCSNVLFNPVSELVYKEGSDECRVIGENGVYKNSKNDIGFTNYPQSIKDYMIYKGLNASVLTRYEALRDTAYSHSDIGDITYHCGYDIFNNHTLRAKEFSVINRLENGNNAYRSNFNTLADLVRDRNGGFVTDIQPGFWFILHFDKPMEITTYTYDTVLSYAAAISKKRAERDGWFGFYNPSGMEIKNYVYGTHNASLNKCINNKGCGDFIDMYPDRSLFSFIPKVNEYRKRVEPNWEYCLTYPSDSIGNDITQSSVKYHDMISDKETTRYVNGLKCHLVTKLYSTNYDDGEDEEDTAYLSSESLVIFKTDVRNNFADGSRISLSIVMNGVEEEVIDDVMIYNVGTDGYNKDYYFSVSYDNVEGYEDLLMSDKATIRVSKVINGKKCKYYFRVFRRLPNFNRTDVYADGVITEKEITDNNSKDFNGTINKLAFERTVYNDNAVQLVINDDIEIGGLRDNLNRPLSEIYLTLIKTNGGFNEWYYKNNYTSSAITYSHCFGPLTAGLDLPPYVGDYNVHKMHNMIIQDENKRKYLERVGVYDSILDLDEDNGSIDKHGCPILRSNEFFGDLVEFNEYGFEETTLEDVFFRFNTVQREYIDFTSSKSNKVESLHGEFANIYFNQPSYDSSDRRFVSSSSDAKSKSLEAAINAINVKQTFNAEKVYDNKGNLSETKTFPVNVNPEGYYYKAHYRLKLRDLDYNAQEGYHTEITIENAKYNTNGNIVIKTDKNYYFEANDKVYFYRKAEQDVEKFTGNCIKVEGSDYTTITIDQPQKITVENITNYRVFRHNGEMPLHAYEFNDGTGRYVWKDVVKEINISPDSEIYNHTFTNGAHYFDKNVNFFLRRQDPVGDYGLNLIELLPSNKAKLFIKGKQIDVDSVDYVNEEGKMVC